MKKVLLLGGFQPGQSLWSIQHGFQRIGYEPVYFPTRGCIKANLEPDIALAREEADLIPEPEHWDLNYADNAAFQAGLFETVEKHRPELLLWWFSKDDRPPGLIKALREQFPWLKTVTHTQDDPWDVLRSPHFSDEFEYAATCCKESVDVYQKRGIKAIVLYPPPAMDLHGKAEPAPHEASDFSVSFMSLYARQDGNEAAYLQSSDLVARITHTIGFPKQRVLRPEMIAALKDIGRVHIYGGLGFGTFEDVPRSCYRGFRTYSELPGIYRAAKININQHNSPESHGYLNQRDTAITGSGGFMLTDYVEGIEEIFEIGKEIDTWTTLEELHDKATWWLRHDEEREEAARRAQQRILKEYGNEAYAQKLLEFVKD
ncbi:MAG: glycosyltransferase [bacterium]|nr:glycosyltransferase [bacterium]